MKNKKTKIAIISVIALILVTIAVTYAYWLVTKTQTGENEISSACLDITISGEKNDIELTNQFPMSDEEGMKLVPYEFTVTNNCNTSVDYQVALEATGTESSAIKTSALKEALNDTLSLLSGKAEVATTIDGAYESRKLETGTLASNGNEGSSATYNLRIWIDKDAPISEMNKAFKSKISVTVGQGIFNPYKEGTLAYNILDNYNGVNAVSELDATEYAHRITEIVNLNIRLVYDGIEKVANGTVHTVAIGEVAYNSNYDNAKYVGYTYDTNETNTTQIDSTIKGVVDDWYDTHLKTSYASHIADSIFCNDREATSTDGSNQYFGAYTRLYENKTPSLKCTNKSDRYTVDDTTNGNGILSNPVGVLTADEVAFAGANTVYTTNTSYYLYNGDYYWTSTPSFWIGSDGYASVWYVDRDGYLNNGNSLDNKSGVRPVINLKADVEFTGDGTIDNPYKIVTE